MPEGKASARLRAAVIDLHNMSLCTFGVQHIWTTQIHINRKMEIIVFENDEPGSLLSPTSENKVSVSSQ